MSLRTEMIPSEDRGEDTEFEKLPNKALLPKPPFTMLALGIIGSGKSSLIQTMMNSWYKNQWDEAIIQSGVLDANDAWNKVHQKKVLVLNEWNEQEFLDYFKKLEGDQMKRRADGKPLIKSVIVMDDMITQSILSRGRSTSLERFITTLRHFNCSLLMSSQSYKLLPRTSRMNMLQIAIMSMNDNELGIIADEHSGLLSPKQFSLMQKQHMLDKSYIPFVIDYKAPPARRFRVGFENVLEISKDTLKPSEGGYTSEEDETKSRQTTNHARGSPPEGKPRRNAAPRTRQKSGGQAEQG